MGAGPKDPATAGALEKLFILLCDERRDEGSSVDMSNGGKDNIAVRTAIRSSVSQVKVNLEFPVELVQLAFDIIADNERVTTADELA